jgi:hypothetical protein
VKSYVWSTLNEAERYVVWSEHIEAGGKEMTFFDFCDLMDEVAG